MPLPAYTPHVLYATAVTSIALHLLTTRRDAEERRLKLEARQTLLETVRDKLRTRITHGEGGVDDEEIVRLMKMASEGEARAAESGVGGGGGGSVAARVRGEDESVDGVGHGSKVVEIGWKDVLFGRKSDGRVSSRDKAETEELAKEWSDGKFFYFYLDSG